MKKQIFTIAIALLSFSLNVVGQAVENIKGSATNNIDIFPNPTDSLLYIKLNGYENDNYTFILYNHVGHPIPFFGRCCSGNS
jgi:hypothetical protein